MKSPKLIYLVFLLLILGIFTVTLSSNFDTLVGNIILEKPEIVQETNLPLEVYFCPQDNCEQILIDLIDSSKNTVHCALYDLDLDNLTQKLQEKNALLVIDKNNLEGVQSLDYITNTGKRQLTHNKFCIIDDEIVFTGSFNPTPNGAYKNNNNMLIFYSKYLAENYEQEFQELRNQQFASGDKVKYPIIILNGKRIENYFCPEDSCKDHIIDVLEKAEKSIYFMTFSFTHDEIGSTLLNKQGIEIKGIFEKQQKSQYSEYEKLSELNVKFDNYKYKVHHKVFIIDEKIVITGSMNPTASGDERNDENLLIIYNEEIAKLYLQEFNKIWNY